MEEKIITKKDVKKVKNSSGRLVDKIVTMLLVNPGTNLWIEIREPATKDLLHQLRRKYGYE